jgi:hypothetical protein
VSLPILKHSHIDIKDPIRIVIASFVFGAKAAGRITIHLAEKDRGSLFRCASLVGVYRFLAGAAGFLVPIGGYVFRGI